MKELDRRVPADFARAVLRNEDIVIHSDGSPTRTFCYVADAISGYMKALSYGEHNTFNIGADSPEISVRQLAEIYKKAGNDLVDYSGQIIVKSSGERDYLTHNPSRRCPRLERAREKLGYAARVSIEEGVRRYLQFLLSQGGKR